MRSALFAAALIILSFQETAQASTLRVACDDSAVGAEVSVNGKFKGECPVDILVPGGSIAIKATKSINGQKKLFEQTLRIGDDVTKRIEVSFGDLPATAGAGAIQIDPKAVARQRYEAELAAYNSSIQSCLPKYKTELNKLEQAVKAAWKSVRNECINEKSDEINNSVEASGRSRSSVTENRCGASTWAPDAHENYYGDELKRTSEYKAYYDLYVNGSKSWCESQFAAPRVPN